VLREASLPGRAEGRPTAALAREAGEPGLLPRPRAYRARARLAGGPSGVLAARAGAARRGVTRRS